MSRLERLRELCSKLGYTDPDGIESAMVALDVFFRAELEIEETQARPFCERCGGKWQIAQGFYPITKTCPDCKGTGRTL